MKTPASHDRKMTVYLGRDGYKTRYSPERAVKIIQVAKETAVYEMAAILLADLEGTSNAISFPSLMMGALEAFGSVILSGNNFGPKFSEMFSNIVCGPSLCSDPFSSKQKEWIQKACAQIAQRAHALSVQKSADVDFTGVWNNICQSDSPISHEFQKALWKLSELGYCGFYFAYENFIVNSIRAISGNLKLNNRPGKELKEFGEAFKKIGGSAFNDFYDGDRIRICREMRHAIVHRGGKANQYLKDQGKRVKIDEGYVVIGIPNTWDLLGNVMNWTERFVNAVAKTRQKKEP